MKLVAFTLTFLMSVGCWAGIIANYQFGIGSEAHGPIAITTTVDDAGLISVSAKLLSGSPADLQEIPIATGQLNEEATEIFNEAVQNLSDVAILRKTSDVICPLEVPEERLLDHLSIARDYNPDENTFAGALQVIHGPQGCWVHDNISLADDAANETAVQLKSILRYLTAKLVEKD